MPCPISPPAPFHPNIPTTAPSPPLHAAADVAVAVGALAVAFAITATTGIAGSFGDSPDVDAVVAALPVLLGGISGGELGIGRRGGQENKKRLPENFQVAS